MKNVKIYSTPTCTFCRMAKDFFKANNIEYTDIDVAQNEEARKTINDKEHQLKTMFEVSKQMGVPVIDIEGEIIVGFNKSKLSKLLGI